MLALIRPLNIDKDLQAAGEVVKASMLPSLKDLSEETQLEILSRYNPENFSQKIADNSYFVAEIENKIVGVIGLREQNRLSTFYVLPEYQGQGIGRQLFETVRALAKSNGQTKLVVKSSPVAEQVYKKFGFKEVDRIYKTYPDGNKSYNIILELSLN